MDEAEEAEGVGNPGFEPGEEPGSRDDTLTDTTEPVGYAEGQISGIQLTNIYKDKASTVRRHHSEIPKSSTKKRAQTSVDIIIEEDYDVNKQTHKLQKTLKKTSTPVARHHTEVLRKRISTTNDMSVPQLGSTVTTRRSLSREGSRAQRFSRLQYVGEDIEASAPILKCRHSDEFLNQRTFLIGRSQKLLHDFKFSTQSSQHVHTRDYERSKKALEHKHMLLISGPIGSGRTHMAMKLAENIMKDHSSFVPMIICNRENLGLLKESCTKAVVIIDDFVGNFRFLEESADEFQAVWNNVHYLIERKKLFLILTCETSHLNQLRQTGKHSFIDTLQTNESVVEILNDRNHPSKEEKSKMIKTIGKRLHSSFKSTDTEELLALYSPRYGFPLLCQLVSLGAKVEDLQESCEAFMESHLNKIINSEIKLYITLVVILIFDGRLKISNFRATDRSVLDKVAALLDVDEGVINDSILKIAAKTADEFYISKDKDSGKYEIPRKFLYESIVRHLLKNYGDAAIRLLPLDTVVEFQLHKNSTAEIDQSKSAFCGYQITDNQYKCLVESIKECVGTDESDYQTMASCVMWEDHAFGEMALTLIGADNFLVQNSIEHTLLSALCRSNRRSAIQTLVNFVTEFRTDLVKQKQSQFYKALIEACKYRRTNVVHLLFGCCEIKDDGLICAAAEGGEVDIINFLITKGVQLIDRKGKVFDILFTCGHFDFVKLYIEKGKDSTILNKRGHKGSTILHSAVKSTNTSFVEYLIDKGADPEVVNRDGLTLLHVAAMFGRIDTVKLLCAQSPKMLHHRDNNGFTAAHFAAREGHLDVLSFLLDQNIAGNVKVSGGNTILHLAAYNGQTEELVFLWKRFRDLVQAQNNESFTASQTAARMGQVETLQACIDGGVNPDAKTVDGRSFLHLAAFNGRLSLVKHLCSHYPKLVEITDADGNTLAHDAAASGNVSVVKFILQSYISMKSLTRDGCTVLHDACYYGRLEVSRYLVGSCPDLLHMKTAGGYTPCHGAALGGYVELFKYLVSAGADPFELSIDDSTALHEAAFSGRMEMVKYLSATYPDLLAKRNKMDYTAAHFAAQEGHTDILSYLITATNEPFIETKENQTYLHIAAYNNRFDIVKFLCERYPTLIPHLDSTGATALHYASRGGSVEICSYLIVKTGAPGMKTNSGSTILHLACYDGKLDLAKHICENYPQLVEEVDETGHNAAHYAAGSGSVDLLKLVLTYGVDPMSRTSNGSTILLKAAYNGKVEVVEYVCSTYPEIVRITDNFGCNLAHYAVCGGNLQVLLYGINGAIDPLSVTSDGHTLLHIAAFHGQIDIVKFLCENFPELRSIEDNAGLSPGHYAHEGQQDVVIQYLLALHSKPVSKKLIPAEESHNEVSESRCQPLWECLTTCFRCRCSREYALNVLHGVWRRVVGFVCFFRRQ